MTASFFNALKLHIQPDIPCRLCQQVCDSNVCEDCLVELPFLDRSVACCRQCALPLSCELDDYCGECLSFPPHFNTCVVPFSYQPPISHWIQNFKDRGDLREGHLLTQLLREHLTHTLHRHPHTNNPYPDILVPAPLHWRRQISRGFNQAAWMAKLLSQAFHIPVHSALTRVEHRRDQRHLNRRQRQRNANRAIHCKPSALASVQHRHVAVIDDVVTSTATARAMSKALMDAGASCVDIWCLARTPKTLKK